MSESAKPGAQGIDALIGNRIRARRLALDIDPETLGRAVGLNGEEIKDHESGASRVRASRLSAMAEALDVPIRYFFEDLQANHTQEAYDPERRNDQVSRPRRDLGF